jgi:drug/metabolite transporter (DMT)-like permease
LSKPPSFAAPAVFVVLWASGFIGAKFGLPYAQPMTFLTVRMAAVVALLGLIALATRPAWPSQAGMVWHSAVTWACWCTAAISAACSFRSTCGCPRA